MSRKDTVLVTEYGSHFSVDVSLAIFNVLWTSDSLGFDVEATGGAAVTPTAVAADWTPVGSSDSPDPIGFLGFEN